MFLSPQSSALSPALRELAGLHDIAIGAAVSIEPLRDDEQYRQTLSREFNMLTTEVALKWSIVHPERDRFYFTDADDILYFASTHEMQVRGHTLVWHRQLPAWLENQTYSRAELLEILHHHIASVAGRYRGQIAAWDVVNEAFNDDGTLRDSIWLRGIGPEYIDYAFQWAYEADPDALLFYNDYGAEAVNAKSDAIYTFIRGMRARGVPINGVGFQMHVSLAQQPDLNAIRLNMERLAVLGLQVHITEMDVSIHESSLPEDQRLLEQGRIFGDTAALCLTMSNCTAFVTWGFTDRHTWIPQETGRPEMPLLFDANYQPKPAYYALRDVLTHYISG